MKTKPSILLLGGGYTLQFLASLIEDKNSFVITSRNEQTVSLFRKKGYLSEVLDITDSHSVNKFLNINTDITCVVDSVPPPSFIDEYTSNLKLIADCVNYSIYLSTTGVYGKINGEVVDENTDTNPNHLRAKSRVVCERIHRETFSKSTLLRLPAIYGPGRGIGHAIKSRRYKIIDQGLRFTNRIQVEDLCATIIALIEGHNSGQVLPEILCVSDSSPSYQVDVVRFYCNRFGFELPEAVSLELAKQQLDPTMLSNQIVSNKLLISFLQRELKYPSYKDGASTEFLPVS